MKRRFLVILLVAMFDTIPWNENHKFIFRWEVFNVANFQPMGTLLGG
ncbi:MAG TPA: hypothetical protein VLD57_08295 [Blastocatellia bacterium]|nr:hypothetical protein [Blastocatellia bacterium]